MMETAMAQAALGEYRRAQTSYEKALEIWRQSGNLFYQATLLNNLGFLHYQLGDYENAAQAFEEGLLCAQRSGYKRMEALISISMGDLYSEIEDFEIAAQHYDRAAGMMLELGDSFLRNYLLIAQANLALLKREPKLAGAILNEAARQIHQEESMLRIRPPAAVAGAAGAAARRFRRGPGAHWARPRSASCRTAATWNAPGSASGWRPRTDFRIRPPQAVEELNRCSPTRTRSATRPRWPRGRPRNGWSCLRADPDARRLLRPLMDRTDRLDDSCPASDANCGAWRGRSRCLPRP